MTDNSPINLNLSWDNDIGSSLWRMHEKFGGPEGGRSLPPPDAGEFSKICKKFLKKIAKNAFSPIFQKKFKTALNFCAFGRKSQLVGKFLRKLCKI